MNTGAALSGIGITMPNDFPTREFEVAYKKVQAHSQQKHEYDLAMAAMDAISYRFAALAEYDDCFTASIKANGVGPAHQIRYEQERDLFGFFSNAFSVFEAFCFALFAIGALTPAANNFPLATADDEKKVTWPKLTNTYKASFPGDPILATVDAIETDPAFRKIRDDRNVLTHRASPPRHHKLTMGSPSPNETRIARLDIIVDATTTASRRRNVPRLLLLGLEAVEVFVAVRL